MAIDLSPEHLRRQLNELDITNVEAAFWCGVSEATIYRWLKGENPIPASVIRMFKWMIFFHAGAQSAQCKVIWAEPRDLVEASDVQA